MSDRWPDGTPKMPPQMCPACGYVLYAATEAHRGDDKPSPGNVSICLNCGDVGFFDEFLRLRPPTPTEAADPEIQHVAARGKRLAAMNKGTDLREKRGGRA